MIVCLKKWPSPSHIEDLELKKREVENCSRGAQDPNVFGKLDGPNGEEESQKFISLRQNSNGNFWEKCQKDDLKNFEHREGVRSQLSGLNGAKGCRHNDADLRPDL